MKQRLQRLKNSALAHAIELSSSLSDRYPGLVSRFIGDDPVQWHIVRVPGELTENWKSFEPDKRSGFFAKAYKSAVVLSIGRQALIAEALDHRGVPAVAFAIGHMVMATELGDKVIEDEDGPVLVTMRKGKTGPLTTTLGTFRASDRMFFPAQMEETVVVADDVLADQRTILYPEAIHR